MGGPFSSIKMETEGGKNLDRGEGGIMGGGGRCRDVHEGGDYGGWWEFHARVEPQPPSGPYGDNCGDLVRV